MKTKSAQNVPAIANRIMLPTDMLRIPTEATIVPELPPDRLEDLLASIKEEGIKEPLHVYLQGTDYVVLDGRHRCQCATLLELKEVPVLVVEKPDDIRLAMVAEAVKTRISHPAGRAALLVDAIPNLTLRKGQRGNPTMMKIPNDSQLSASLQLAAINLPVDTIEATARRFGVPRIYLGYVIAARSECRPDTDDWAWLRAHLCANGMSETRILSALRGHQSGGKNDETGEVGRKGADVDKLACRTPATLSTIFKKWGSICDASQDAFMTRFRDALKVLPTDGHVVIRDSVKDWPEHECRELQKAVADRIKSIEKERKA